jgi:hypothetical protein
MKRYEYRVMNYPQPDSEKSLNVLGAAGWRLICVDKHIAFLMREVQDEHIVLNEGDQPITIKEINANLN